MRLCNEVDMRHVWVLALGLLACGDSDDDTNDGECTESQVIVMEFREAGDVESCAAIPEACGTEVDCADNACISALYDLCPDDMIGVGCSDTFPPAIVSCNE